MCGIAGIEHSPGEDGRETLASILAMLRHRGPDDSGDTDAAVWAIGMTRLAIMDPEHARQPMRSADERWSLVVNGEIYNFRRLRDDLMRDGVVFRTRSDTEVLLELIARRGPIEAVTAAEGMFALAAVDTHRQELWLARDRFGEKPLYLDHRSGFAFASELMPLLIKRGVSVRPSPVDLVPLLRYGFPAPGTTAIEGIGELPPAHWLRRTRGGIETRGRYWAPPDRVDEQPGSVERCVTRVLDLLDSSVSDRLVADVPLGLFLSGGIDSGAVAAAAQRSRPDIRAVTVGFDVAGYDERPLARLSSRHVGIRLEEEHGAAQSFSPQVIDETLRFYGQPFQDTSAFPTRAVSRAARRHFKVVLSGDGGDELFSGYLANLRASKLRRFGGGGFGGRVSGVLAAIVPEFGRGESLKRALTLNRAYADGLLPHVMEGVFTDEAVFSLFEGTQWKQEARDRIGAMHDRSRALWQQVREPNLAMSLFQLEQSLPQDILTKVDRMSMAESLEVRSAFLDSKLAAFALSLPARLKVRGDKGKLILRDALKTRLPQEVLAAPKRGFNLPVREWMGRGFWKALQTEVAVYAADSAAEMNTAALARMVSADEQRCLQANSYRALHRAFLLYTFFRWRRVYVSSSSEASVMLSTAN